MFVSFPEKYRPASWDLFVGQSRWLEDNGIIRRSISRQTPASLLFWGPPGCGKTSLAQLYIKAFSCRSVDLHPSRFHTNDVKQIIDESCEHLLFRPTILWIDEIHRLTRPQQDLLLRGVEEGSVVVVAATTENPSFVLSNALLSRITVVPFSPLHEADLMVVCNRVLGHYPHIVVEEEAKTLMCSWANGDARRLLTFMETIVESGQSHLTKEIVSNTVCYQDGACVAKGEGRYLLISALHKSVRGSDCQAALYWLARLLIAGEDPLYIARRLVRMATEDIGLADPQALSVAWSGHTAFQALGSPEGELALAEVVVYLALAPKSNSVYTALADAKEHARATAHISPPMHIINAPTSWMQEMGFGRGYQYDHDEVDGVAGQTYMPEGIVEKTYYTPVERGFERDLKKRIHYFSAIRQAKQGKP